MIEARGYATITGPRTNIEADTYTCAHCNAVRYLKSNSPDLVADEGGICRNCMTRICSNCIAKDCMAFERKLDIYETRQDLWKKLGLEL